MSLPLTILRIRFPADVDFPPTISLYIKEYYEGTYTLIASNIQVDNDGTLLDSPITTTPIDPTVKYVLKAVNELCGFEYEQALIINPYCPIGYDLSPDSSYCFFEEEIAATPPTASEVTITATDVDYSTCGSYIYDPGYSLNGTGSSTQINTAISFWVNGAGLCASNVTNAGPLNRTGLWATTTMDDQTIGFAVCLTLAETKTYYIGMGCDNLGIVKLDGVEIIHQDPTALGVQYGIGVTATFKVWHIYPVELSAGNHILELIGYNDTGIAAFGMEIYDNTAAEIAAATGYGDLNMIFTSTDYIGQPVQLGSNGIGYSCPSGYSLAYCESPIICRKLNTTPVLY